MNGFEIRDREVQVLEVGPRVGGIAIGLRVVEREDHAAAVEVVPSRRDAETGLFEQRRVEVLGAFEVVHGEDDAVQTCGRHETNCSDLLRGRQDGTLKYPRPWRRNVAGIGDSYRERAACPLYTAIGVIEGRWKPMIFQRLASRPHGFGELRRAMPRVTPKVLREHLRQMQADNLVARDLLVPARMGVRYRLTPYGRTLGPVFETLWRWGVRHLARPGAAGGTLVSRPVVGAVTREMAIEIR